MNNIIRDIQNDIQSLHARPRGRLLVITGARQVGKTTLARMAFPKYPIISLDSPIERALYSELTPADWLARYPHAILDEIQKMPILIDTIKACYDRDENSKYILLGSSQILFMKRVAETLAGRAAIREIYPFSIPELMRFWGGISDRSNQLIPLLSAKAPALYLDEHFPIEHGLTKTAAESEIAWDYFLRWGGMPRIADKSWTDEDRFEWLCDYQNTYLQRDLADLARLDRLEPFVRAQKAAAMRTAKFINHAEIARLSEISSPTAKEFLRYLEISYQVIQIPAWFRNTEKRLAKQSKLHFLDPGIRRAILRSRGEPDGFEFESAVVAEIFKRIRSAKLPLELFHLRTSDGREIDLLIEREDGFIALECKATQNPQPTDARHFRNLTEILDKPLLLALIICGGKRIRKFNLDGTLTVTAIPAHIILS